ncbi:PHP domain-containing protein [Bacteroides sp. 224]|uniref:PHP domain-containing protein n=1 Tax=Bacteroides sp. 224 TaxID=2302936 RepID=UPI0013D13C72|nr:PHP domain-containing protein [Bacteroides sp. 224]NDV63918.1 PHP domain-containing protein [Bacteroides sp. 224]
MKELIEWLITNKVSYKVIDDEVIEIIGFGKMFFEDTDKIQSIFKKNKDGALVFNSMEQPSVLIEEGINYAVFKFGNNFYYTDLRKDFKLNILKYIGEKVPPSQQFEYANLGIHTPYELLNGSFMPKSWVEKAQFCRHPGIGICDQNTMAACFNLQKECEAKNLKFVFGYSLNFIEGENKIGAKVYVQTQKGLQNLLRIQKAIMVDSSDKTIQFDELIRRGDGNIIVLNKYSSFWIKDNKEAVWDLQDNFIDVFFQVDLSEYKAERIDVKVLNAAKLYFDEIYQDKEFDLPPVLLTDCYYLDRDDAKNKIILNKVAEGAAHEQSEEQFYKDVDDHYSLFEQLFDSEKWDIPALFQECCDNSMDILENANARFDNTRNFMPKYDLTLEEARKYGSAHNMFNQLLDEGFERLVPKGKEEQYRKQMEYEKYIIESTNNVDYLLVQYDTCNWARQNGILVGCGRGSAAGSLLLFLLGITLIDPIKYDLIFERFLLPERAGLYPSETTIISEDISSNDFIEITLENGKTIKVDKDAELIVKREAEHDSIVVYADEIQEGDDILFDNRDVLFTINEL